MKRSRDDDVFENSHPKRPAISSGVEQTGLAQMSMSSAQRLTTTDALSYLKTVKEIFQDRRDKYEDFLDVMKDFKAQRIETSGVILRVKELFKGNRDLILGFNTFLPKGYEITLPLEDEPFLKKKPVEFEEAIGFVNKIKTRFQGDDHVYKAFLHILNMYRKDSKSITEVYREVSVLFQDHADLLVDFTHFLPDTSGTASVRYASVRNHNINGDESAFRDKVKVRLQDPEIDEKFSDCIHAFIRKMFTADHFRELVYSLLGTHSDVVEACEDFVAYIEKNGSLRNNKRVFRKADRDGDDHDSEDTEKNKDRDFRERDRQDRGLVSNTKDVLGQRASYANKEKFMAKPIQELDLSNCESCTPSYRLLPENYPIPAASWRTEIGAEVLNDHWVSVTSGSEDYSFKHMRKNQYEESLFRCEDDRFELDMLLESVNATAKRVEELLDSMNAHTNKTESPLCVEDHLTALNLRCIERLYGDHGLDVMDVLRKNAPLALPVILTRLKQKQEEWTRCRADFNKVWADIYAKNYHKSLDHRSFYFKQQDAKNLSTKALLAEIKEISENNQNEDEEVLSIGAGHRQPVKPHMEFHYPDPEVQEDVCELIKYSCGEVCTPEQSGEVLRIWRIFLEPLLDVCSRSPCARVNGYAVTTNNHIKQNLKNVGEENSNLTNEAAYCKPLDMSENGDMLIPSEDNGSSKCGVTCNAPQSPAREMNVIDDNTSATLQGNDQENSVCGTVVIPNKESQVGVIAKLATCSIDIVPEEVKAQKHNEETEGHGKAEREEGELSPNKNLEDNNFSASENTDIKVKQSPCQSDPITTVIGREEMHIETGEETDANVDDEGRGSAQGSSESENDSENGNVTGTESANGEEISPKNPIGDGKLDKKTESEGEADSLADVHDTERMSPLSDLSLRTVKPLKLIVPTASHGRERNSRIFYGNDSLYLLFRLHQMLYERMLTAKSHALSPENKWKISNDANPTELYARFKDALRSLLNGSSDNAKFEDECRAIIGTQSYILFTLDKLIHKFIKQLQIIATEDENTGLLQLSKYEGTRSFETFTDAVYHVNARFVFPEDSLYRIECLPSPARLTIQSLKSEHNRIDPIAMFMDPYFESYLNDELLSVGPEITKKPGVFLKRNKKIYLTEDGDSDTGKALEDIILLNGVEMKVNCISLKISYVLDTEDFFYRPKTRRKALYGSCASIQTSTGQRGAKRRKLNL